MKKNTIAILFLFIATYALAQDNCFENCLLNLENSKIPIFDRNHVILQQLIGCKAPDFSVKSTTGENLVLDELKGKIVVLNFWFIGCAPCIAEIPSLNKLVDEYTDKDVVFIAFGRDNLQAINEFVETHKFKYKIVSSDYDLEDKYCIIGGWPTNIVIDKKGVVRKIFSGGFTDDRALIHAYREIKPIIEENLSKR